MRGRLALAMFLAVQAAITSAVAAGGLGTVTSPLTAHSPREPFDPAKTPPAPDYSHRKTWAADGGGDSNMWGPPGQKLLYPESRKADVFYIYSTGYFSNEHWNQPMDDVEANAWTDTRSIRSQASVFNLCCQVYAPRYRQMTFGGFLEYSPNSKAALNLAYSDVKRAFEYFLIHYSRGRPFILAGHSQGARHAKRLIEEEIDGTPLAKRMVAAYVPGTWVDENWFATLKIIKPCERASDTGCVLTWNTLLEGSDAQRVREQFAARSGLQPAFANRKFVCTNPLTWTRTTALAPANLDLGGWLYDRGGEPRPVSPHLVSAHCDDGALFVSRPAVAIFRAAALSGGDYRTYDYQLAYLNIRANALARVNAFLAAHRK